MGYQSPGNQLGLLTLLCDPCDVGLETSSKGGGKGMGPEVVGRLGVCEAVGADAQVGWCSEGRCVFRLHLLTTHTKHR